MVDWRALAAPEVKRPVDDLTQSRMVERVFIQRFGGIVALSVAAVAVGIFPLALPVAIVVVGGGVDGLALLRLRQTGRLVWWIPFLDVLAAASFIAAWPRTLIPAVVVMTAATALAASLFGPRRSRLVVLVGATALLGATWYRELADPGVILAAYSLGGLMLASAVGRLAVSGSDARAQLDTTIDNLDAILWVRPPGEDRFTFVNRGGPSRLGWTVEEWLQPGFWRARVHPDDLERVELTTARSVALGLDHEVTYRFRTVDDRWVHLHDRVTAVVDSTGQPIALQGMSLDITERVRIEERISQYADLVEHIDLPLLVLAVQDARSTRGTADEIELCVVAANDAAEALVGRGLTSVVGRTLDDAFPALARSQLSRRLAEVVERGVALRVDDLVIDHPSGHERVTALRAFPLSGRSVGVSLQDVTDAVETAEALRRQALYDGLTGLPNRRFLDDELHRAVREAPAGDESVALLMMDLDQFKEVNDALGHQVGDMLLREIGGRLARLLDQALVARLGGDEFAVVLVGRFDLAQVQEVADRIRRTLAAPYDFDDLRLQSNASIGIALFPAHAEDPATLIRRADVAMYQAKKTGVGVAVYAAEADTSSVERVTLIGELPDAAPRGEFVLHFQPCVDLRTGRIVRAEALIRWNHPRVGMLGPDQFIELAELSGAIQPLTRWVVDEGLSAVRTWQRAGHRLGLAVNLSVRNLYDPDLVPHLARALERSGVAPGDLLVELTETELMDDPGLAREVFVAVGDLGVGTSIDDFGTGYSSLTYLRDLPLREIKVDQSFVREMHRRSDEFTIVRSMIDLGHNLGLDVVAEGVEHADDLTLLQRLGCDLAQGFYLSPPLPLPDLLRWLEHQDAEVDPPPSAGRPHLAAVADPPA